MVAKVLPNQAAKRKKTAEMHDSPPKRVTRARAKAIDEDGTTTKQTKITTASAKMAGEKKRTIVPAKATKRKTRADDEEAESIREPDSMPAIAGEPKAEPPRARAKQKKQIELDLQKVEPVDAPKPKGRAQKAAAVEKPPLEAPRTRGRPKKATWDASGDTEVATQVEQPEPAKKTVRDRTTTNASKPPVAAAVSKPTATKKKVKFQDEPGKENIPIGTEMPEDSAMKPTGLKAKPVRKPASARATTRGRKAAQETVQNEQEGKKDGRLPLSPKKATQVARTGSIGSTDELAGEKTPIRALSQSPLKGQISPIRTVGSVSKLSFPQITAPSSPSKTMSSSINASPRRPPPSPFKDGLKSSPKKVNLGNSILQPVLLPSQTTKPTKALLLQESPKKMKLTDSTANLILAPSQSPLKASLLQSPARRPVASPFKATAPTSPSKSSLLGGSMLRSPAKAHRFSPQKVISGPLRATRSPEQAFRVRVVTDEERDAEVAKTGELSVSDESPMKQAIATGLPQITPFTECTGSDKPTEVPSSLSSTPQKSAHGTTTSNHCETSPIVQGNAIEATSAVDANPTFTAPVFFMDSPALRRTSIESGSTDELASPERMYAPTPLRRQGACTTEFTTPPMLQLRINESSQGDVSMTPLAEKLSSWAASSPHKQAFASRKCRTRGVFSFGPGELINPEQDSSPAVNQSPVKPSFFDDEIAVFDAQDENKMTETVADSEEILMVLQTSLDFQVSQEYGDENAVPQEAKMLDAQQEVQDQILTCTPAKAFYQQPREIHTVSKIPLRASAEDSPFKVTRPRSRSVGGPLATISTLKETPDSSIVDENNAVLPSHPATPVIVASAMPETPGSSIKLDAETPGRTVRKGIVPNILKGAVVYVDVHTTEGADASGIFVDLLTQMGARCVKQWNWNPRAGMGGSLDSVAAEGDMPDCSPSAAKVGITHVVYKDGGKRTLEKVRGSNGVVICVGVGWVLDCEREDKWLDEADYAIDTSVIPRGGHRRRKSMEPRALSNLNGNLVPAGHQAPAKTPAINMSPTKEFLTFDTPSSRRETFIISPQPSSARTPTQELEAGILPATPNAQSATNDFDELNDGSAWGSPTTPYYLSKAAELVQRTCPSKQMLEVGGLFPISGNVEDQPDESVRQRLLAARRKSLQWVSKTRSPLGRTVSYGK